MVIKWPSVGAHLQSSSHSLHTVPVPGMFVGDDAHLYQEGYYNRLPKGRNRIILVA